MKEGIRGMDHNEIDRTTKHDDMMQNEASPKQDPVIARIRLEMILSLCLTVICFGIYLTIFPNHYVLLGAIVGVVGFLYRLFKLVRAGKG